MGLAYNFPRDLPASEWATVIMSSLFSRAVDLDPMSSSSPVPIVLILPVMSDTSVSMVMPSDGSATCLEAPNVEMFSKYD